MKKKSIFSSMKVRLSIFLFFVSCLSYPEMAKASGWTPTGGSAMYCNGVAYTANVEEFRFLGIVWSTRTIFRNGQNEVIDNPCPGAPGTGSSQGDQQ
jgi:hypothetical protein